MSGRAVSPVRPPRFAAIDIGTNSVLCTVAERTATGLAPVVERATITRLGKGVDRTRELAPASVEATLACLAEYAALVRETGAERLAVVGTSALRDARGGAAFCARAEAILGVTPLVISGAREAELTFAGALMSLDAQGPMLVVDVGGGSTEIIVGDAAEGAHAVHAAVSLDVGSVRLFERHVTSDPPDPRELAAVRDDVQRALRSAPTPPPNATLVGVAGTVTTLLAVERELHDYDAARVHNQRLTVAALERTVARLASLPLAERRTLRGLQPARADVIVAGGVLVAEVAAWARVQSVLVSDRGVRWGLLRELAGL